LVERTQNSGLGCPVRQALLVEAKTRELEAHDQKPNDGGLPFGAAFFDTAGLRAQHRTR
jgi:hypothetical protein